MASNGYGNSGSTILVLYRIVNHESDKDDPMFNAFHMPRSSGTTLKAVKEKCEALRYMNSLGADGYHWRVCVEDKPVPGGNGEKTYSWWDIQDENARLPVKEAPQSQIAKLFAPPKMYASTTDAATKAAKGAFKNLSKAMNAVAGTDAPMDHGPPVSVVAFKLLDLMKMHDDFSTKHGGKQGFQPPAAPAVHHHHPHQPRHRAPAPAPAARQPQQQRQQQPVRASAPPRQHTPPQQRVAQPQRAAAQPARQQQPQQQASLLDFGAPTPAANPRTLHHTTSSPAAFDQLHSRPQPPANETRAEKLKREYAQKQQKAKRVWDDVDQRWVEVDPKAGAGTARGTTSAPPGTANPNAMPPKKKEVGIKLDPANAAGKSHQVQAAVHKRVNDMRQSQQKAIQEIKEREEQKKREEAEEDLVKKKLDPKIKAWSEEHGKKKQLRALLGTLHTILWPEANWKPIGLGDLLDDNKCKRAFHKASRVVHPDKTHHLDAEKRFLAKRIFDALSQAKTQFDEGAK